MPEFFLELFSEEIPARMQAAAASALEKYIAATFKVLGPADISTFYGPRRIAITGNLQAEVNATHNTELGPRITAPEQAKAGFARKHKVNVGDLKSNDEFYYIETYTPIIKAAELVARDMPGLLRRFSWPKSMRWGGTSQFTWVRPLRRIVCLLDGVVVPFSLADGSDDGHNLTAGNLTEGHRFLSSGAFSVKSCGDWQEKLRKHKVLTDAPERRHVIAHALSAAASERGVTVVDDPGLLDEVAGLVEWPVVLIGKIDQAHMDLPPEVMQVSMRVNQRYFALRNPDGSAASSFAFAANIEAIDGGAVIIAGNERVLRARFSDARHFWDLDRKIPLADLVEKLDHVTFHAKLGSQGDRVRRLRSLAVFIAPLVGADPTLADRAAELCKADLSSGMVGEFPELQGVMGGYYARHDNEDPLVADAIREHYSPKGQGDDVPTAPISVSVALADRLYQLAAFFDTGERPTGSGDPYALRRAALGIIRLIRQNGLRLNLGALAMEAFTLARQGSSEGAAGLGVESDIVEFIIDRLRVQLRADGARHDVLTAVFAAGADDDIVRLLARTEAVATLLGTEDGANLFAAYRRAANILRIEEKKDGPHNAPLDTALLTEPQEIAVADVLDDMVPKIDADLATENYAGAMSAMATLRVPLDAFFDKVTVNDPDPKLRLNRLRLLSRVRATMDRIADFSKIEG